LTHTVYRIVSYRIPQSTKL